MRIPMKFIALTVSACLVLSSCSDDSKTPTDNPDPKDPEEVVDPEDILDDIKIKVKNATASAFQNGEGIEKSFDGDFSTIYHSPWDNSAENYFPITLTYNFNSGSTIDYIVYNPRTEGWNGHIKEFDLYIATASQPNLKKYDSYDFKGRSTASRINFSPALENPIQIQFVVKSGAGDGQGFVSCAEMEFFQKNDKNFDYLTIFADKVASQLKPDVTQEKIDAINNKFFKDLATKILAGTYETEFRVQEYSAWQHPDIMAKANKTSTYGLRDNPTGIFTELGQEMIVFLDETTNQDISLFIQKPGDKLNGSSYSLNPGLNKFKAKNDGLIYVMYYTETGTEPSVKINIATGTVNGYFDKARHTQADWNRLLNNATAPDFDVKGKYAVLTFRTSAFKQYTPDGLALINAYDDLVYNQQDFMGLVKYNRMFKNRAHFLVVEDGYMYAGGYHTGYNANTQNEILDVSKLKTTAVWGPAHEVGHTHQTRPGLRWAGLAEVTNNIHSLYIQTLWGNKSRIMADNTYNLAINGIIVPAIALNEQGDVFYKLIPFWQLKLYLIDVLGKEDFYKDLYEFVRITPDVTTNNSNHGLSQLQFIKEACDIAQLDLTEFFEDWGFLKPIDKTIDDYGKYPFKITQDEVDEAKAYIAGKGYSKPIHKFQYITDDNVDLYKNNISIVKGSATMSGKSLVLNGWSGVTAFEVYRNGKLEQITTNNSINLSGNQSDYEIRAVGAKGTKEIVTIATATKVSISGGTASVFQPGENIDKSYDGNLATMYHSPYNTDTQFPVTLTYNFQNVDKISYLFYHPRATGTNGIFQEFDLYVATETSPTLTKQGTYNFNGSTSVSQLTFSQPLIKPTQIQFVIKSAVGNYVSCSEMEFFE